MRLIKKHFPVTRPNLLVAQGIRQCHLDGHLPVLIRIVALIDNTHAAAAYLAQDLVFAQLTRERICHSVCIPLTYPTLSGFQYL